MDPVRKQRRITIASVIAVFVVVCGFWAVFIFHTQAYKTYRRETKLKETLQAIKPPSGATVVNISTSNHEGFVFGAGVYSLDSEFDKVKSHYLDEFPRHGFVYKGDRTQESQLSVDFCAPDYDAVLVNPMKTEARPRIYMIMINWKDTSC
jgi:hypothetical protein